MNRNRSFSMLATITIAMLAAGSVYAQNSVALPGVTVSSSQIAPAPTPVPQARNPIGLYVNGWQNSSSVGQGYNAGGDGKGTVTTLADGFFRIGADSYLTGNSNPDCTAKCSDTQAKLFIIGEQLTGARATNQGVGTMAAPVASVAGTNGMFAASLQTVWQYKPQATQTLPPTTP